MVDLSNTPLDSCDISMLNEAGTDTLGNILCHRAALFAPGQHFQSFVKVCTKIGNTPSMAVNHLDRNLGSLRLFWSLVVFWFSDSVFVVSDWFLPFCLWWRMVADDQKGKGVGFEGGALLQVRERPRGVLPLRRVCLRQEVHRR